LEEQNVVGSHGGDRRAQSWLLLHDASADWTLGENKQKRNAAIWNDGMVRRALAQTKRRKRWRR
jgi:hypothetical protein